MINFTKIYNPIIDDFSLSDKAFRIYSIIAQFQSLEGFKVYKGFLAKKVNYSVKTLERVIRELKEKGLVILNRIRKGKSWEYFYSLNNGEVKEEAPKQEAPKKVAPKKEVAPKVETQLDGQIELEEAMESVKNDDIENIANKCVEEGINATREQMEEALNITNAKSPKNAIAYTLGVLRNMVQNRKSNVNQGFKKSLSHMNFSQREYDWNELENELLGYGLEDSVNELDSVPQLPSFIGSSL